MWHNHDIAGQVIRSQDYGGWVNRWFHPHIGRKSVHCCVGKPLPILQPLCTFWWLRGGFVGRYGPAIYIGAGAPQPGAKNPHQNCDFLHYSVVMVGWNPWRIRQLFTPLIENTINSLTSILQLTWPKWMVPPGHIHCANKNAHSAQMWFGHSKSLSWI